MKIFGLICELNILHNGHIYLFDYIKKQNPHIIIFILSGNITSRGDISLYKLTDKIKQIKEYTNIIIIPPTNKILQRADIFAKETIKIVKLFGINNLVFSEEDSFDFINIYNLYNNEKYNINIKNGISFKKAYTSLINLKQNQLLSFFYQKEILENNLDIKLHKLKRINNISSSKIREDYKLINILCPYNINDYKIRDINLIFNYIKISILTKKYNKDIEYYIIDKLLKSNTLNEFLLYSNKTYTKTRLKRELINMFINKDIDKDIYYIPYFDNVGKSYLKKIKKAVAFFTNLNKNNLINYSKDILFIKILDFIYNESDYTLLHKKPFI